MTPPSRRSIGIFGIAGAALAGIALMFGMELSNSPEWSVDFDEFYSAGKLAGTGHVYDWPAIQTLELRNNVKAVPYGRFPVFALFFKPISMLPYTPARVVWFVIELAALAGFVALWPSGHRAWAILAICWSEPVARCLSLGQDSILFLFFVALGLRLLTAGRDFWAGVALSLCAAKPHMTPLIPVVLAATQRWKALLGAVAGWCTLMLLSFGAEGVAWPERLLALTRRPDFDPAGDLMPNLRGLLTFFGDSRIAELALALLAVALVWMLSQHLPIRSTFALVLACGLLLSHHAYFYDALLLLPALLLSLEEPCPEWLRKWAIVLFTPMPYLLLLTRASLPGHLALSGYTIALLGVLAARAFGALPSPQPHYIRS